MRLETFPLVLGVLLGLLGLALLFDAWAPEEIVRRLERRSRPRRERDKRGEALVGLGIIALAAALLGRDTWRYSLVTVIAGSLLLLWGSARNAAYFRGVFGRHEERAGPGGGGGEAGGVAGGEAGGAAGGRKTPEGPRRIR